MRFIEDTTQWAVAEMTAQLEAYLRGVMQALGVTVEEFARDYTLEEWPIETQLLEESFSDDVMFRVRQQYRVRRKTDEELALGVSS